MNTRLLTSLVDSEWTFRFYIPYIEFRNADGSESSYGLLFVGLAIIAAVGLLWLFLKGESRG